jgi:DNA polymerase-4
VGPKTTAKMERLGIETGADLRAWSLPALQAHFGSSADWYWRIARGIDEREVRSDRPHKSVSAERTFNEDLSDPASLDAELERVARYAWERIERASVSGRTVTLKVKFQDFTLITRSKSFACPIARFDDFHRAGRALMGQLHPLPKGIRLLGLGLHNLAGEDSSDHAQLGLAI